MSATTARQASPSTQGDASGKPELIRWLEDLSARDTDLAGGKGANLGELCSLGMPVPPGYVLTAESFRRFLDAAMLRRSLRKRIEALDVDDTPALSRTAAELQEAVRQASVPDELRDAAVAAYRELARRCEEEAPSVYPEITEKLVEWGIHSISVNPDVLVRTRNIIASAEQRLLLNAARHTSVQALDRLDARGDRGRNTVHSHHSHCDWRACGC